MTTQERLELINVKLQRAKEHFHSLSDDVRAYLDSQPYVISVKRDPESRRLIYFVDDVRSTPTKLSAILGDTIHNLRSALDHLAYQLVWVGTGKIPTNHVYFPIADDETKYPSQRDCQLKGASLKAISDIDAIKPYGGGNELLWKLHKLNNVDKHRILITAGSAFQSVNIGAHISQGMKHQLESSSNAEMFSGMPPLDLFIRPADRMFPLKPGDELFIDGPDSEPNENLQFRFEVAFGEEGVAFGEPIIETLSSMVTEVENIIPQFGEHLT